MQLRSAAVEADDTRSTVVNETAQGYAIYTMLRLTKPLYRKLEFIAQLYDQSINECICDMLVHEVQATLDNTGDLGDCIRTRILEEAYDLGREAPNAWKEKLEVELEGEKLP